MMKMSSGNGFFIGQFMDHSVLLKRLQIKSCPGTFPFPFYYYVKFAFQVWLQLPSTNGAGQLYTSHLRPFLLRHQSRLDQILEHIYNEMVKIISARQAEIKFARVLFMKLMSSVNQIGCDHIQPGQRQPDCSIEGPRQEDSDRQSESGD